MQALLATQQKTVHDLWNDRKLEKLCRWTGVQKTGDLPPIWALLARTPVKKLRGALQDECNTWATSLGLPSPTITPGHLQMVLELQFDSRDSDSLTEGVSGFLFPSRDASATTAEADLNV
eukprot:274977-Ditylum_brightwellii.AAC.1